MIFVYRVGGKTLYDIFPAMTLCPIVDGPKKIRSIDFVKVRLPRGDVAITTKKNHYLEINTPEDLEMHKMLYPEFNFSWAEKCLKEHLDAERKQ